MSAKFEVKDSLPVRYRPKAISEIVGNKATKEVIQGYFKDRKLVKTWLFAGSPGSGKTTIARIIARTVNCFELTDDGNPCGKCESCKQPIEGHSDIKEINGTVDNKVDDMRNLIKFASHAPRFNFRVFIIDEAQGLTPPAKNALLKSIEEPPPSTIWIFCTTDPNKLPPAIISRCNRQDLKYPTVKQVALRLANVTKAEYGARMKVKLKNNFEDIAVACNCQLRNAIGTLEKVVMAVKGSKGEVDLDSLVKRQAQFAGSLDADVMQFLKYIYKGKIREPLALVGALEQYQMEEFIKLLGAYSHYATLFIIAKIQKSKVGKGFWNVNRIEWEKHLTEISLKSYMIPLALCGVITDAIQKVRSGVVSSDQVILSLIYDFLREIKRSKE